MEQIQGLIDKIKSEGIQAAEEQAKEIEQEAQQKAKEIVREAKDHAKEIVQKAEEDCLRKIESSRQALRHASRDMMLSLRKEIERLLMAIVAKDVQEALSSEKLEQILSETIKGYISKQKDQQESVVINLKTEDQKALEQGVLSKLQTELKQTITLRPSEDISAGFTISFDSGKSCFDFTESSLVEYLSHYLNPALVEIMKESKK